MSGSGTRQGGKSPIRRTRKPKLSEPPSRWPRLLQVQYEALWHPDTPTETTPLLATQRDRLKQRASAGAVDTLEYGVSAPSGGRRSRSAGIAEPSPAIG